MKRLLRIESELSQYSKQARQETHEVRQSLKDTDLVVRNLRREVSQSERLGFMGTDDKFTSVAKQSNAIDDAILKLEKSERKVSKSNADLELQVRDTLR